MSKIATVSIQSGEKTVLSRLPCAPRTRLHMPEFCPPDYLPPSANSGERQQFFSNNGRDWQQECFSGREGTADRWQQVSAEIWTNRGDLPPVLADFVTRQQQAIERADKLDPKQILNNVHAGFDRKMQTDLQIASSLARNESPASTLKDAQNKQDWENWNNYKDYLSPAGKRASMGFALISSGIDRHIEEGERMLVQAVRLRPELQFNEDFQKRVVQSYKDMARTRIDMGLPMYRGALQLEPINSGRQPILGTDPAQPLLADARKQGQERGIKGATEQYDKAVTESDNKDFSTIKNVRLATFVQRLLLDRTIIESEVRGIPSGYMRNQRQMAADREAMVYDRYMSPGKVRSEAAFDMIASGDPQMFERGKKLLVDALKVRPELEFSEKFNRDKQAAFLQHFRNAQKTDGSKVPSPPSKPQWNSDDKTNLGTFPQKADGFKLPPFLVPQKQTEPPAKQPGNGGTVPGADNRSKGSGSPPQKVIDVNKPVAPKIAGADSTVPYKELPAGNPFDKSKGFSQKDIEDLAAKGIVALLLAGGAYKLIKKGNEYFFEKQKPAEDGKPAEGAKQKPRGDVAKAETDRQAEVAKHAAKVERLNTARQAEIERTHAEGLAAIERLTGANKAEVERITGEKDAVIQQQKSALERVEAALADANKARETERQAAETQRQQLETSLRESEQGRTSERQTSDTQRQRLETSLKESEQARATERQTADAQRQQLETSLKESEQARASERQTADAQRQQLETSLKESEQARATERQTADAQRQQLETSLKESEQARATDAQQRNAKLEQTAEQLRSAQGENAELKTKNGGLQNELDSARSTNTTLQSQVEDAKRKNASLEQNLTDAQSGREAAEKRSATLQQQLTDTTTQRDEANKQNATLQESLTKAQSERDAANERNVTLQTTLTETEAKQTTADSKVAELSTALQQSEQTRAGETEKANAEQARLQQLLETSEAGKTASNRQIETLQGDLEKARAERDRVTVLAKGDRAQLEADIRSLTEQLQKAIEDKSALEKTAGKTSVRQQRQIAELQRKLAEATGKLTEKDGTLADNERKLAEKDQTIAAKDETIAARDKAIAEEERKLTERDQTLSANQQTITEKDQALAESKRTIAERDQALAENQRTITEKDQALAANGRKLTETDQKLADANAKIAADAKEHATNKQALEQQVTDLTSRVDQLTEQQRAEQQARATERATTSFQVAELQQKLGHATTDGQQKDDAIAKLKADHERQLAELTKRAEQAEQAKLAADQARQLAEQGRQAAEQKLAGAKPADAKPVEAKPAEIKPAEIKPADTKVADAEPARVEVPQTTEQPTAPRRRIRGGAVQLDTTVIAQNEGNGTFSREVAQGSGIDGTPESQGKKISADQIQLVKDEIQRLKETKIATDETKAKNLERVLSIIERTDSPRVQEAAHKYIDSRILDGESRHAEAGGGARAAIGRGVSAGIVVSAFLSYYTMREEMLRKGEEFETSASVGSSKK